MCPIQTTDNPPSNFSMTGPLSVPGIKKSTLFLYADPDSTTASPQTSETNKPTADNAPSMHAVKLSQSSKAIVFPKNVSSPEDNAYPSKENRVFFTTHYVNANTASKTRTVLLSQSSTTLADRVILSTETSSTVDVVPSVTEPVITHTPAFLTTNTTSQPFIKLAGLDTISQVNSSYSAKENVTVHSIAASNSALVFSTSISLNNPLCASTNRIVSIPENSACSISTSMKLNGSTCTLVTSAFPPTCVLSSTLSYDNSRCILTSHAKQSSPKYSNQLPNKLALVVKGSTCMLSTLSVPPVSNHSVSKTTVHRSDIYYPGDRTKTAATTASTTTSNCTTSKVDNVYKTITTTATYVMKKKSNLSDKNGYVKQKLYNLVMFTLSMAKTAGIVLVICYILEACITVCSAVYYIYQ
ncbi:hypothetical protein BDB01DRAFT_260598 [Pilobolus umbonatus]|nr:hypothetical protein BDB01DRAFT_260598 [Pilobolus umbonatus]